jgi:RNA recognition motif-containing protein
MKLYVGNLSFKTTDDTLRAAFEAFGQVASAQVVMDRETGRSRGFGFVEMPNAEEAQKAIDGMHGKDFEGRDLTVNEAKPREAGGGRSGGGWGGGGGRSGGGGGWGGGGGGRSGGGGGYGGGGGGRSGGGGYGGGGGGGGGRGGW